MTRPNLKRILTIVTLSVAVLQAGCAGNAILVNLGQQILSLVFAIGGLAAAIVLAVIGVRLIIASATGSSYATTQAVFAFLGAAGGLVLMLTGPAIADAIIKSLASVQRTITLP
ncbi:MAG: hypothetical protein M1546_21815 [Chloroflexi bacterium]|nr:hypothetical protein [Chloroflexota bacterium]